jgi:hypothetical protein
MVSLGEYYPIPFEHCLYLYPDSVMKLCCQLFIKIYRLSIQNNPILQTCMQKIVPGSLQAQIHQTRFIRHPPSSLSPFPLHCLTHPPYVYSPPPNNPHP